MACRCLTVLYFPFSLSTPDKHSDRLCLSAISVGPGKPGMPPALADGGSRAAPEAAARSEAKGPGEDAGAKREPLTRQERPSLVSGGRKKGAARHPCPPSLPAARAGCPEGQRPFGQGEAAQRPKGRTTLLAKSSEYTCLSSGPPQAAPGRAHANEVCISAPFGTRSDTKPPRKPSPRAPLQQSHATAAPCGPFQAWTSPLPPPQGRGQPRKRGTGLAHPFHCKTSQPLPVDNCKQLPTATVCHQVLKNSLFLDSRPFGA